MLLPCTIQEMTAIEIGSGSAVSVFSFHSHLSRIPQAVQSQSPRDPNLRKCSSSSSSSCSSSSHISSSLIRFLVSLSMLAAAVAAAISKNRMLRFLSRPSSSSLLHLIQSGNANVTADQILCESSSAINSSLKRMEANCFNSLFPRLGGTKVSGVKVRMMSPLTTYVKARGISIPVRRPPLLKENVKTDQNNDSRPVQLLTGSNDGHGGVIVDFKDPMDSHLFVASLRASMLQWKQQGKKGIWIKIPIELANLVEAAVKEGFRFHHAEPKYLMLAHWLPETPNTLPANVTHQVGIGAFVMNDKKEVLVVQERIGKLHGIGLWKFPTGVINEGEDVCAGAVREVKEETGIDTEFVEVLAFSENTKTFFEKSDLFFFCMLRPRTFKIQMQELEIEAAQWMPLEEYAAQPFIQEHILLNYGVNICFAKISKGYGGFSRVPIRSSFSNKSSSLYLNSTYLNHPLHSGKDF